MHKYMKQKSPLTALRALLLTLILVAISKHSTVWCVSTETHFLFA